MLKHAPLLASVLLVACAAATPPQQAERLPAFASEAAIRAAQLAPLSGDAAVWNEPVAPFQIIGPIHYVGAAGVSAFLIATEEGHILLDGGLAQTAPQIIANIAALGFDIADVKILLNSHAHFDHSGGLAALQRASGALFIASEGDRQALELGHIDYGPAAAVDSPPIRVERVIADGETVALGGVTLTAVLTPGHTPGCTSWMMPVTGPDSAAHTAFFHCSATVAGQTLAPESYPGMIADFRRTFARGRAIEADVFLANHPMFFSMTEKRARQLAGDANAFVDPEALARFSVAAERAFEAELARQSAAQ